MNKMSNKDILQSPPKTISRALFVGINYDRQSGRLEGCVGDVNRKFERAEKFYTPSPVNTRVLTDDPSKLSSMITSRSIFPTAPTRNELISAAKWLVQDAKPGDLLFWHYSGHGSQKQDTSGDEEDGMDECLCPCDYQSAGTWLDDDIRRDIFDTVPEGVYLLCEWDCCHSGTMGDLKYNIVIKDQMAPCISKSTTPQQHYLAGTYTPPPSATSSTMYNPSSIPNPNNYQIVTMNGMKYFLVPVPTPKFAIEIFAHEGQVSRGVLHEDVRRSVAKYTADTKEEVVRLANEFIKTFKGVYSITSSDDTPPNRTVGRRNPRELKTFTTPLETKGVVVVWSGCSDNDTSADANFNNTPLGAMTYAHLAASSDPKNTTNYAVLFAERNILRRNGYTQVPQMSVGTCGSDVESAPYPLHPSRC